MRRQLFEAAGGGGSSSGGGSTSGGGSSSGGGSGPATKRQRTQGNLQGICATATQQDQFTTAFARWIFQGGVSFNLAEHQALKDALAVVGLQPPTRRQLAGPLLQAEAARVRSEVQRDLALEQLIQLATDGWRRKSVDRGCPLINVMALLATGGSKFVKVHRAPGIVKDAEWLRRMHLAWAREVSNDQLHRILGIVMDNTAANRYTTHIYALTPLLTCGARA